MCVCVYIGTGDKKKKKLYSLLKWNSAEFEKEPRGKDTERNTRTKDPVL